jgi:hypothetical protein
MWLLELIGISLVAGTVLGVSWRIVEDWWDRHEQERIDKKVMEELTSMEESANKPE